MREIVIEPHPAVTLGYLIVEAMKDEGVEIEYEGIALIAAARLLMEHERAGLLEFTRGDAS